MRQRFTRWYVQKYHGEWQVLAWAYMPAMNEIVSANLWQQLLEVNKEDSDVRIAD